VSYLILWLRKNDHLFLPHYFGADIGRFFLTL